MHYLGNGPPSISVNGHYYFTQQKNRVIPREVARICAVSTMAHRAALTLYAIPFVEKVSGRVVPTLEHRTLTSTHPSIRPWGSLGELEVASLGLPSLVGIKHFVAAPRIWAVSAVEGWLEMRLRVK